MYKSPAVRASLSVAEWHDASDIQVVLKDGDNESVSSEATTVVPGEEADEDSTGAESLPGCRRRGPCSCLWWQAQERWVQRAFYVACRQPFLRDERELQRTFSTALFIGGAAPLPLTLSCLHPSRPCACSGKQRAPLPPP